MGGGNPEDSLRHETPSNEPSSPQDESSPCGQAVFSSQDARRVAKKIAPPQQTLWTGPARMGKFSFVSTWPFARVFIVDS